MHENILLNVPVILVAIFLTLFYYVFIEILLATSKAVCDKVQYNKIYLLVSDNLSKNLKHCAKDEVFHKAFLQ